MKAEDIKEYCRNKRKVTEELCTSDAGSFIEWYIQKRLYESIIARPFNSLIGIQYI